LWGNCKFESNDFNSCGERFSHCCTEFGIELVVDAEGGDVTSLGHEDEDGTVSCLGLSLKAAKMPHCPRAKRVRELRAFPAGDGGTLNLNKAEVVFSFQKKIQTPLLGARLGL